MSLQSLADIGHDAWLADQGDTTTAWRAAAKAIVTEIVRELFEARITPEVVGERLSPVAIQKESVETRDRRIARAYERYAARLMEISAELELCPSSRKPKSVNSPNSSNRER